jgi:predicted membrane channel-forming protein YqfA (hemolysin III family)
MKRFFKLLSKIFSLESKQITKWMGIFFPGFAAHIYAYFCIICIIEDYPIGNLFRKIIAWIAYSFFLSLALMSYIALFGLLSTIANEVYQILGIVFTILLLNSFVTYVYGSLFYEQKEKNSSETRTSQVNQL